MTQQSERATCSLEKVFQLRGRFEVDLSAGVNCAAWRSCERTSRAYRHESNGRHLLDHYAKATLLEAISRQIRRWPYTNPARHSILYIPQKLGETPAEMGKASTKVKCCRINQLRRENCHGGYLKALGVCGLTRSGSSRCCDTDTGTRRCVTGTARELHAEAQPARRLTLETHGVCSRGVRCLSRHLRKKNTPKAPCCRLSSSVV